MAIANCNTVDFGLNTKFSFSPESDTNDFLNDASCLLSSARAQLRSLVSEMCEYDDKFVSKTLSTQLFGSIYLIHLTEELITAADKSDKKPVGGGS